jgi:hypothetical protein
MTTCDHDWYYHFNEYGSYERQCLDCEKVQHNTNHSKNVGCHPDNTLAPNWVDGEIDEVTPKCEPI